MTSSSNIRRYFCCLFPSAQSRRASRRKPQVVGCPSPSSRPRAVLEDAWERPAQPPANGHDCLFTACHDNDARQVTWLFSVMPELDVNHSQGKALRMAARFGFCEVASVLLAQPAIDVNLRDTLQISALHLAVMKDNVAMVRLLLERTDVFVNELLHGIPLFQTVLLNVQRGAISVKIAVLFLQRPDLDVHHFVQRGHYPSSFLQCYLDDPLILRLLLCRREVKVNKRFNSRPSVSPLQRAVRLGLADSVQALLMHPKIIVDDSLWVFTFPTPGSASNGRHEAARVLLRDGRARIDTVDPLMGTLNVLCGAGRANFSLAELDDALKMIALMLRCVAKRRSQGPRSREGVRGGSDGCGGRRGRFGVWVPRWPREKRRWAREWLGTV